MDRPNEFKTFLAWKLIANFIIFIIDSPILIFNQYIPSGTILCGFDGSHSVLMLLVSFFVWQTVWFMRESCFAATLCALCCRNLIDTPRSALMFALQLRILSFERIRPRGPSILLLARFFHYYTLMQYCKAVLCVYSKKNAIYAVVFSGII